MKELTCEDVLMAQMAAADGEEPGFAKEQLSAHIADCANCQHELKQSQALDQFLTGHTLSERRVDLWLAVEKGIAKSSRSFLSWRPFALIGLLLVIYKLLEMLPARDPGIAFKLVPLVIVVLLFVFIKENPFRINTELVLER
jgi:anti-sigma factor RsiW